MPLSHKKLAHWYYQLSNSLAAGLTLKQALESSEGPPVSGRNAMVKALEDGKTIEEMLREASAWLPIPDRFFLSAGASTGRLAETCTRLALRHQNLGESMGKGVIALLYPLFILHLLVFIFPITGMIDWESGFNWSTAVYLRQVAMGLIPLWGTTLIIVYLIKTESPLLAQLMRLLPGFRQYQRHQSLADLANGLACFLEAGLPVGKSWKSVGALVAWPPYKRLAAKSALTVESGLAPGSLMTTDSCLPSDFRALYQSGERSGQLVPMLSHAATQAQGRAQSALLFCTFFYPTLALGAVSILIIAQIFSVFSGYIHFLDEFLK